MCTGTTRRTKGHGEVFWFDFRVFVLKRLSFTRLKVRPWLLLPHFTSDLPLKHNGKSFLIVSMIVPNPVMKVIHKVNTHRHDRALKNSRFIHNFFLFKSKHKQKRHWNYIILSIRYFNLATGEQRLIWKRVWPLFDWNTEVRNWNGFWHLFLLWSFDLLKPLVIHRSSHSRWSLWFHKKNTQQNRRRLTFISLSSGL